MIGPTGLFHHSPAPHFKTFQVDMRRKHKVRGICEKIQHSESGRLEGILI